MTNLRYVTTRQKAELTELMKAGSPSEEVATVAHFLAFGVTPAFNLEQVVEAAHDEFPGLSVDDLQTAMEIAVKALHQAKELGYLVSVN
jgi:hypothetical protein